MTYLSGDNEILERKLLIPARQQKAILHVTKVLAVIDKRPYRALQQSKLT